MPEQPFRFAGTQLPAAGGTAPLPQSPGVVTSNAALDQIGQELAAWGERKAKAHHVTALNRARLDAAKALQELESGINSDPDYRQADARFEKGAKDIEREITKRITGRNLRDAFLGEYSNMVLSKRASVAEHALKREADYNTAVLDEMNFIYGQAAAEAGSDQERNAIIAQGQAAIEDAFVGGWIDAVEAGKRRRGFASTIDEVTARKMMQHDPWGVASALLDDSFLPHLDAEKRIRLQETAQSRAIALENRAETSANRHQRDVEEKTFKDLIAWRDTEQPTAAEFHDRVLAEQDNLSKTDFAALLTGEVGDHTDPIVYTDLRQRAAQGEDISVQAADAWKGGSLKKEDYDKLETLSTPGVPGMYQRGDGYIKRILGADQQEVDIGTQRSYAEASEEWLDWLNENREATPGQSRDAYREIANRWSLDLLGDSYLSLPKPRYLVGGRNAPDLEATRVKTREAAKAGTLSVEEFKKEITLIQRWENVQRRQAARAAERAKENR